MEKRNFIEEIIEEANLAGRPCYTRFPPEPNGHLHIGHAKSICLNFGIEEKYNGSCNLRFDDTNPETESSEYVDGIRKDVHWLGFTETKENFTSDYFDLLYDYAVILINKGKAYVCDLTAEEIAENRGVPTRPGIPSPNRDRTPEENLLLFQGMKNGDFPGGLTLRAKIDMNYPNLHLRDPIIYRIKKVSHHRTGDKWNIYPMYDWAHGLSDAIEGITHSLCTLEFEVHRPLYKWFLEALDTPLLMPHPRQIEFARLNLSHTVMSKRILANLVKEGHVTGWDDPRMPTISGLRRRGYTPTAIRNFCETIGVTKVNSLIDVGLLEHSIREDLNKIAPRRMAVLDPLKLIVTNYDSEKEITKAKNFPEDETATRPIVWSKELWIEREDFREEANKKYKRMVPGRFIRLKYGYIVKCTGCKKDAEGNVTEVYCTYIPEAKSGEDTSGIKPKGTIHWVSAEDNKEIEVRLYDRLFAEEDPTEESVPDPNSLVTTKAYAEQTLLKELSLGDIFQFERLGYFCVDPDSKPGALIFNRTVTLKDTWNVKNEISKRV